tara:strand:- start:364 stop:1653 length:1290 start_codon:yes stop_codon:yes gene_type:complete
MVILGIIIRLVLVPFLAHPFDMFAWYRYVDEIQKAGVSISSFGIIPIWNSFLIIVANIYGVLSNILHISVIPISELPSNFDPSYGITVITDPIFNTLIKTPLIIADVLSAFLIYKISFFYSKNYSVSRRSAYLYLFSPIVIWISAAWGQYDSLAVLFTLLALYYLLVSKRMVLSATSLYIAVLIKIYPIVFVIPIIISIYRFDKHRRREIGYFLIFLFPLGLYLIIFQSNSFLSFLGANVVNPSGLPFASGFGLTYWSVALLTQIDTIWTNTIMYLILLILMILSLNYIVKGSKSQFDGVITGSFLLIAALFLSYPVVSEQRSLILLAFLSLMITYRSSLRTHFILLSSLAFLYAQKNFPFYLLPLASRYPDSFSFLFSSISPLVNRSPDFITPTTNSGLILFIIGTSFSIILFITVFSIYRMNKIFKK